MVIPQHAAIFPHPLNKAHLLNLCMGLIGGKNFGSLIKGPVQSARVPPQLYSSELYVWGEHCIDKKDSKAIACSQVASWEKEVEREPTYSVDILLLGCKSVQKERRKLTEVVPSACLGLNVTFS